MKARQLFVSVIVLSAVLAFLALQQTSSPSKNPGAEQVFFCPEDHCAQELAQKIDSAKSSVHAAVYSFTSGEIASAMVRAKERGVEVKIVTDYTQAAGEYSKGEFLEQNGIEVKKKKISGGSMHDKFVVIDGALAGTGSFNYTENADERNDENLVFLTNKETIAAFESEFLEIWQQAS